jgi:hypothetical protein
MTSRFFFVFVKDKIIVIHPKNMRGYIIPIEFIMTMDALTGFCNFIETRYDDGMYIGILNEEDQIIYGYYCVYTDNKITAEMAAEKTEYKKYFDLEQLT